MRGQASVSSCMWGPSMSCYRAVCAHPHFRASVVTSMHQIAEQASDRSITALGQVIQALVLPRLNLRDLASLKSVSSSFKLVVQTAPDSAFQAAVAHSNLPCTLFSKTQQELRRAAAIHEAVRSRRASHAQ